MYSKMSNPDWESLQLKAVRSLFLAVSSVFVVFYGFTGTALASDSKEAETQAPLLLSSVSESASPEETLSAQSLADDSPEKSLFLETSLSENLLAEAPATEALLAEGLPAEALPSESLPSESLPSESLSSESLSSESFPSESFPSENLNAEDPGGVAVDSTNAADLKVPFRFGASVSTSPGFDEVVGAHAFVPIRQTAGESITFVEGSVQLTSGSPSLSANLGHRKYDADNDLINGGYIGVDSRTTDDSTFYQLAAGYERIAEDWEIRANGYLPVGDQTSAIASIDNVTTLQANSQFEGNQLVLSSMQERQRVYQQENALGGFDVEVGTDLAKWDSGDLTGHVGAYLLTGEESSLGVQGRLESDFASRFNAGLSLQHDGVFGTSVGFSVRASFPGPRFHRDEQREFQDQNEVAIRLRDPITRRPNVAINVIQESETTVENNTSPLRNPEEEQDYRFVHVDLAGGAGAGDGTYENPFGAVEDAIALLNTDTDTYSDGNTVVYVDGENAPTTTVPGFSVPDRVRVLSQGPTQTIAGMAFPGFPSTATRLPFSVDQNFNVESDAPNANGITVELPDSNDGVFPTITGGANADLVSLGESTVLAGFEIRDAANHGVTAANVNNVELRNNLIENVGGSGISLDNVGGSVVLFDNEINNSGDRGIHIQNSLTEQAVEVAIAGFDLNSNPVGMEFLAIASETESPSQRVSIGPSTTANTSEGTPNNTVLTNSILNSANQGIIAEATGSTASLTSTATQEIEIANTTVDGSGAEGVRVLTRDGASSQEFSFASGTVSDSAGNGFTFVNGEANTGPIRTAAVQELIVRNSTISDNGGNGIDVTLADAGAQELVIASTKRSHSSAITALW
ncbi:MAG: right-handed parallel beta-helix repeat-containing protein [Cyanobacteria bacterium J06626_6]